MSVKSETSFASILNKDSASLSPQVETVNVNAAVLTSDTPDVELYAILIREESALANMTEEVRERFERINQMVGEYATMTETEPAIEPDDIANVLAFWDSINAIEDDELGHRATTTRVFTSVLSATAMQRIFAGAIAKKLRAKVGKDAKPWVYTCAELTAMAGSPYRTEDDVRLLPRLVRDALGASASLDHDGIRIVYFPLAATQTRTRRDRATKVETKSTVTHTNAGQLRCYWGSRRIKVTGKA